MPTIYEQYSGLKIEQLLEKLENAAMPSSPIRVFLENLLSVRTAEMVCKQLAETAQVTAGSVDQIRNEVAALSTQLAEASAELRIATTQSSQLGRNLNLLTGALVVAAVLTAGATIFQAIETKRQADLLEKQPQVQPASTSSPQGSEPGGEKGRNSDNQDTPTH